MVISFLLAVLLVQNVFAQDDEAAAEIPFTDDGFNVVIDDGKDKIDCFDYYQFQSVQVSVGNNKGTYQSKETVKFSGELINKNDYPVVDGNVFVRIGKVNENYVKEGNYIVDEFFALEDVNLDAGEKKPVDFKWVIPASLPKGNYKASFYFSVGKKYNLGGLPFTNEVVIGVADFDVESENGSYVSFDRAETKVNDNDYNHIGNWPTIAPGEKVVVSQPIKNTYGQPRDVNILYELYFWDSLNKKDKVSERKESITVPAGASTDLSYEIPKMDETVYYLKVTALSGKEILSIINVRVVSKQERPRINYPAITKFPLKEGDGYTLFSCFHNTSALNTQGEVLVTLHDKKGNEIDRMVHKGDVPSAMSANKVDLAARKDLDYIVLKAKVFDKNNKVVDEYEAIYDCQMLKSKACAAFASSAQASQKEDGQAKKWIILASLILLIIVLVIIIIVIIKKTRDKNDDSDLPGMSSKLDGPSEPNDSSSNQFQTPTMLLIGIIGSALLFGFGASIEKAQAVTYNDRTDTVSKKYDHGGVRRGYPNQFNRVSAGTINVNHRVGMVRGDMTILPEEEIEFLYDPEKPNFNGSGGTFDTPYGEWCKKIDKYCSNVANGQMVETSSGGWAGAPYGTHSGPNRGYMMWTAVKPDVSYSSDNDALMSCDGAICTAHAEGVVTITADIDKTKARAWSVAQVSRYGPDTDGYSEICDDTGGSVLGVKRCNCGSEPDANFPAFSADDYDDPDTQYCNELVVYSLSGEDNYWPGGGNAGNGGIYTVTDYGSQSGTSSHINTLKLKATTLSWVITIENLAQDGVCENIVYGGQELYELPADTSLLCSSGTMANLVEAETGWTWDCLGVGGGVDADPSCSASFADIRITLSATPVALQEDISGFPVTTTLNWSADNVESCTALDDWLGYNPIIDPITHSGNGSDDEEVDNPGVTERYTIECTNWKNQTDSAWEDVTAYCEEKFGDYSACDKLCGGGLQYRDLQTNICDIVPSGDSRACNEEPCDSGWIETTL